MKNSTETVWNGTRDLPVCSAVPQPTALPPRNTIIVYSVLDSTGGGWRGGVRTAADFLEFTAEDNSVLVPTWRTAITLEHTRPSCRILTTLIFCHSQRVQGTVHIYNSREQQMESFSFVGRLQPNALSGR